MTRAGVLFWCWLAFAAQPDFRWREVTPGYRFAFPRDHFSHADYRTEWWYYTGNVNNAEGARFGFELVFFRQGQSRGAENPSAWRIDDLYLAHAAISDVQGKRFQYDERLNRAGPGIAGADFEKRRIWNGNWSVQFTGDSQVLNVITPEFRFSLQLTPLKPLIINGVNGVSQKAEGAGKASYYVSFPLMSVVGTLDQHAVKGSAWMDHEWFTHQLAGGQVGWDWFSAQLDNHTELMLFELRRKDGSIDPYSSGTYVDASGKAHHLSAKDFRLTPMEKWTRYPVDWRIEVPSLSIAIDCRAVLDNQELKAGKAGTTYWEGSVNYSGSAHGVGYLEMTGYDRPVDF
jgi:predicted secreted hydrolase